jgi:hypothetical protein
MWSGLAWLAEAAPHLVESAIGPLPIALDHGQAGSYRFRPSDRYR